VEWRLEAERGWQVLEQGTLGKQVPGGQQRPAGVDQGRGSGAEPTDYGETPER